MREDFLHFCWKFRKLSPYPLTTTSGEPVTIIQPGQHNTDAGPDFSNARIKIGSLTWAGDVEIHVHSREWDQHQHQQDPAYNNVILHVVYRDDKPVRKANGEPMPTLELASVLDLKLVQSYEKLLAHRAWIPCADQIHKVHDITWIQWKERMTVERLESRVQDLDLLLRQTGNSWEEAFYQRVMQNMGMKVNAQPFLQLAKSISLTLLAKHKNNALQVSALLFGQAGLLAQIFIDDYPIQLQKEYDFLRKKYQLQPLPASSWKWLRLRPANFPSIRLAQISRLIHQSQHLFSQVCESDTVDDLKALFQVQPAEYWNTHYQFDKPSSMRSKRLGESAINNILINSVVPFVFFYGRYKSQPDLQEKAIRWLEELPAEKNQIINKWSTLTGKVKHAGESQGLLHLKKYYCDQVRCLHCTIGNSILKPEP